MQVPLVDLIIGTTTESWRITFPKGHGILVPEKLYRDTHDDCVKSGMKYDAADTFCMYLTP